MEGSDSINVNELLRLAQAGQVEAACALLATHIGQAKEQLLTLMAARRGTDQPS